MQEQVLRDLEHSWRSALAQHKPGKYGAQAGTGVSGGAGQSLGAAAGASAGAGTSTGPTGGSTSTSTGSTGTGSGSSVPTVGTSASGAPRTKEPLSIQTTSVNFRRFVAKAGPVFALQDSVERVVLWDDQPTTLLAGALYGFVCWYPKLLILAPNAALAIVLLHNHPAPPRARTSISSSSSSAAAAAATTTSSGTRVAPSSSNGTSSKADEPLAATHRRTRSGSGTGLSVAKPSPRPRLGGFFSSSDVAAAASPPPPPAAATTGVSEDVHAEERLADERRASSDTPSNDASGSTGEREKEDAASAAAASFFSGSLTSSAFSSTLANLNLGGTGTGTSATGSIAQHAAARALFAPPPMPSPSVLAGTPSAPQQPAEVDYLANLQNIQIMMGRVSDMLDGARALSPYVSWHPGRSYRYTLAVFQLNLVALVLLACALPVVPWRHVFLLAGWGALLALHPVSRAFARAMRGASSTKTLRRVTKARVDWLMRDDALDDAALDPKREIVLVARYENERVIGNVDASSAAAAATAAAAGSDEKRGDKHDGALTFAPEPPTGGELPEGFEWLRERQDAAMPPEDEPWVIDTIGDWAGHVDEEGWVYLFADGSTASSASKLRPSATGAAAQRMTAYARRRRWLRRAIS